MYHLLIPLATALAYGLGIVAVSYATVERWIKTKALANGYVDLIKKDLENGNYTVIAGAFSPAGVATASKTWANVKIDSTLNAMFVSSNAIRIKT
jgi:hypothetical protein